MARTAFIIGGTGQIGTAAASSLEDAGWDVTRASRHGGGEGGVALDRDDTDELVDATAGFDLVVDTVAFAPVHARQLHQLDIGNLVVISTASVYLGAKAPTSMSQKTFTARCARVGRREPLQHLLHSQHR